jgi:hypothetical protein
MGILPPTKSSGRFYRYLNGFMGQQVILLRTNNHTINHRLTKEKTKNGHDVTDHGNAAYAAVWYVPSGAKTGFSLF